MSKGLTGEQLRNLLAELMEPEAWAEYYLGKGRCANMDGWKCMDTLNYANIVMTELFRLGVFGEDPGQGNRSSAVVIKEISNAS